MRLTRCPVHLPRRLGGGGCLLHAASFALTSLPAVLRRVLERLDAEPTLTRVEAMLREAASQRRSAGRRHTPDGAAWQEGEER